MILVFFSAYAETQGLLRDYGGLSVEAAPCEALSFARAMLAVTWGSETSVLTGKSMGRSTKNDRSDRQDSKAKKLKYRPRPQSHSAIPIQRI